MGLGVATILFGGAVGLPLVIFGARMLITGRAPGATARAFLAVRDAGMYHLLFGLALLIVAIGASVPSGVAAAVSAVIAVGLVAVAVIKHRPRRRPADR
jgi:hypothetical protein